MRVFFFFVLIVSRQVLIRPKSETLYIFNTRILLAQFWNQNVAWENSVMEVEADPMWK